MNYRIYKDKNFNILDVVGDGTESSLETFINENQINGLSFNNLRGFYGKNLNFLESYTNIEYISIENGSFDLSGVENLINLKAFIYSRDDEQIIDFSPFKKLEICYFEWRKGSESLFNCTKLKDLTIRKYDKKDLSNFIKFDLDTFKVSTSKIESLHGIEAFSNLKKIELVNLKKLIDFSPLQFLKSVEILHIEGCKKLDEISFVAHNKQLKKLVIVDCSDINSLSPLVSLEKLEEVYLTMSTKILDGNMKPLFGKKYVQFGEWKHYTHNNKSIKLYLKNVVSP